MGVDLVPFVHRVLGSVSWVQGAVDCFGEEWVQFVGFVAAGKKVAVESEGFTLNIRSISAEVVNLVSHAKDKARQDPRGVGRMCGGIQMKVHCFFKQSSVDAVFNDANG
jgi:hypothetical protein